MNDENEQDTTSTLARAFAKYRTPEARKLDRRAKDMMEQQYRRARILQGNERIRSLFEGSPQEEEETPVKKYVPIIGVRG